MPSYRHRSEFPKRPPKRSARLVCLSCGPESQPSPSTKRGIICVTGPTQNPSRSSTYASRTTRALLTSRLRVSFETAFGARPPPPIGKMAAVQNEENAMSKQDLLDAVASQTGNTKAAVDETLTAVLATITKKGKCGARGAVGRVR